MNKTALITGVTGQDGSYLAEILIEKGYMVYGLVRRSSLFNRSRIEHIDEENTDQFKLLYGDLSDSSSLNRILDKFENFMMDFSMRDVNEYLSQSQNRYDLEQREKRVMRGDFKLV